MGNLGERGLVDSGIQTDESDFRAHVGFNVGAVYFFPTANGRKAIEESQEHRLRTASQPGVNFITGKGFVVPWDKIENCQEFEIPPTLLERANCQPYESTSIKGKKAVFIVKQMLMRNLLPITLSLQEVRDRKLQIRGEDIIVTAKATIQVKCDYKAGARDKGGTGNLFLQIAECNPLRRY